jgi:hypothetical protein
MGDLRGNKHLLAGRLQFRSHTAGCCADDDGGGWNPDCTTDGNGPAHRVRATLSEPNADQRRNGLTEAADAHDCPDCAAPHPGAGAAARGARL